MSNLSFLRCTALAALVCLAGGSQAAEVLCGNSSLGVRQVAVDPGLTGGFCFGQNGNFNGDNFGTQAITNAFAAAGGTGPLVLRGKEVEDQGDVATPLLGFTGARSGTWTVDASLWSSYDRLFLAFHFGGGGNTRADNPDSFIVELARANLSGNWRLTGNGAQLNDLSNIYVLSNGVCTTDCGGGVITVPEPGAFGLAGLALMGVGLMSRRRKD